MLKDKSYLVRSYAIEMLGNIKDYDSIKLIKARLKTKNNEEKIRVYYALYMLGKKGYMRKLYKSLNDTYYIVRIAVVNLLFQLSNHSKSNVVKHLKKRLKIEDVRSVKIAIKETITNITNDTP